MIISILATKLYIPPPRPKIVPRPRLIERLNEDFSSGNAPHVILISAPAGFGKTTLVREWIEDCKLNATGSKRFDNQQHLHSLSSPASSPEAGAPQVQVSEIGNPKFCWLSLDEGDSDPIRFLTYLVAALRTVAPNLGEEVLAVLQSPQSPPIEPILTALLNEITTLPDQTVLVLDDYHRVDAKPVDQTLTFLLEHLPPQIHLVITTREDPNLPLARLRARGQLIELRSADLRFIPSEAAGFVNQMMGLNLSAEDIAALEMRTEGWIAGLQLAALAILAMQGQKDASSFIKSFTGTHHFVMDYLIEEVLHQQSEKVKIFLLHTSILDRMCGSLCDAVLLDPSASGQETLEFVERANLFIFPLDNERHWYRYHHLFADLLRQRLGQSQTPEEIAKYHIRASEWYEKNGDAAEAFRHLIAARDFGRAAGLAEITWQAMYDSFQPAPWLGWVKQLPEEILCSRPVLCTQMAWGLMNAHEVNASESRLQDAERCLEGPSDGMVIVNVDQFRTLPARIAFARAYNAQTQRDFLSAMKYAELALKLTPEENQYLRAQTTAILGATYLINGDLDAACRSMSDWIDSSMKVGDIFSAIAYAMAEKADILTAQGHLREALRIYQQALYLASDHESGVQRVMAHHYLGMAMLYHEMGDDEAAGQHLQKSLGLGGIHRSVDWSYRRCIAQARLKESMGELEAAIDLLGEAKRFYIKTLIPYTRPIDAIKARIYLKQGRLFKAEEWVHEQGLLVDDELSYLREYEHITLARVLLAEYQKNREEHVIHEVLNLLERLLMAAEDQNRMGSVLEILVTQTLVYQAQGGPILAFTSLERALTLAQPEGYVRIFADEGEPMRTLLLDFRAAKEKQPLSNEYELKEYVGKLLSAFSQPKDMPPSNLVELLSQRELEILRLIAQGLSNREISERLFLALSSVKGHNQMIFSKLQVQSRTEAVAQAREMNLL
jgi:LuxR family transcriptional regulator, maltose regulon positive regulatory protein